MSSPSVHKNSEERVREIVESMLNFQKENYAYISQQQEKIEELKKALADKIENSTEYKEACASALRMEQLKYKEKKKEKVEGLEKQLKEKEEESGEKDERIKELEEQLREKEKESGEKDERIKELEKQLREKSVSVTGGETEELKKQLKEKEKEFWETIAKKDEEIRIAHERYGDRVKDIERLDEEIKKQKKLYENAVTQGGDSLVYSTNLERDICFVIDVITKENPKTDDIVIMLKGISTKFITGVKGQVTEEHEQFVGDFMRDNLQLMIDMGKCSGDIEELSKAAFTGLDFGLDVKYALKYAKSVITEGKKRDTTMEKLLEKQSAERVKMFETRRKKVVKESPRAISPPVQVSSPAPANTDNTTQVVPQQITANSVAGSGFLPDDYEDSSAPEWLTVLNAEHGIRNKHKNLYDFLSTLSEKPKPWNVYMSLSTWKLVNGFKNKSFSEKEEKFLGVIFKKVKKNC